MSAEVRSMNSIYMLFQGEIVSGMCVCVCVCVCVREREISMHSSISVEV